MSKIFKGIFAVIALIIIVGVVTNIKSSDIANVVQTSSQSQSLTLEKFNKIETGMNYKQVVEIVGQEGTILSETDLTGDEEYKTIIYQWYGKGDIGANANVTFQGGKVVSKAQIGLK